MGELSLRDYVRDYSTLKDAVGAELTKASQSFVKIGYLLKRARDEEMLLKDSGYADIHEFAKAEFGLDRSQVSRFIRINDRFSVAGYTEILKTEYENYGSAKLSLMLTLPDDINEELSPEMSKSEINLIKTEYEAEQKISDLEVLAEEKDSPDDFVAAVVKELNDEHPGPVSVFSMAKKLNVEPDIDDIKEAYMPDGDIVYIIRISGQGRFMLNMKADAITITNVRHTDEKTPLSWEKFAETLKADISTREFKEEEKPKKEKPKKVEPAKPKKDVAPVQETAETLKAETKTEPVDVWKGEVDTADITHPGFNSKVEPEETIKAVSIEEAHPAAGVKELTSFQKEIIDKLGLIQSVIENMEMLEENWNKVTDMMRETIIDINKSMYKAVNGR